jgi:hypothetical protein
MEASDAFWWAWQSHTMNVVRMNQRMYFDMEDMHSMYMAGGEL